MTCALYYWSQRPIQYQDLGTMWKGTTQGCGYEEGVITVDITGGYLGSYYLNLHANIVIYSNFIHIFIPVRNYYFKQSILRFIHNIYFCQSTFFPISPGFHMK